MSCIWLLYSLWRHFPLCVPLQVFWWQLFSQQPPVFRVGRCAVVRTWQGQTWNPGLRPSRRAQKGPIALPYCLSAVSHYYPSTTNNLIRQAPRHNLALTGLAGWIWASRVPKSCTPFPSAPYYAPLSQLSSKGMHSLGSCKADWEVPLRLLNCQRHRARSSLTLSTQATQRWGKRER